MRGLGLLCLFLAPLAAAQELPALYSVTDVAADDVLHVRQNPRATAEKIGELAHDAQGVEVVGLSESGDWGQVNTGEGSGWVRMRFLGDPGALAEGQTYFDHALACFGTEPFWGLEMAEGRATLSGQDLETLELSFADSMAASGHGAFSQAAVLEGDAGATVMAVVRRQACSDGMSDRAYGLGAEALINGQAGRALLTGCCSIAP